MNRKRPPKNNNRKWTEQEILDSKHSKEERRKIVAGCVMSGSLKK